MSLLLWRVSFHPILVFKVGRNLGVADAWCLIGGLHKVFGAMEVGWGCQDGSGRGWMVIRDDVNLGLGSD